MLTAPAMLLVPLHHNAADCWWMEFSVDVCACVCACACVFGGWRGLTEGTSERQDGLHDGLCPPLRYQIKFIEQSSLQLQLPAPQSIPILQSNPTTASCCTNWYSALTTGQLFFDDFQSMSLSFFMIGWCKYSDHWQSDTNIKVSCRSSHSGIVQYIFFLN